MTPYPGGIDSPGYYFWRTKVENRLIKSNKVFSGRIFEVLQDQILLPNGQTTTLDIISHINSVVVIPINNEGNLLFVRQYRHPTGSPLLELPAGVLNNDESPEKCAHRELREETGMDARSMFLLGEFYLAPGYSTELMNAFLAKDLFPDPLKADEDEFITVESFSAEKVMSMVLHGEIKDAKTLAALFLAKPYLNSHI
jgi:ADP-ribose pyrophosphatase